MFEILSYFFLITISSGIAIYIDRWIKEGYTSLDIDEKAWLESEANFLRKEILVTPTDAVLTRMSLKARLDDIESQLND